MTGMGESRRTPMPEDKEERAGETTRYLLASFNSGAQACSELPGLHYGVVPERVITMKDVADAAGVARSTVSLALRHDPSIPEETRNRILAAAEKVGYKVNPLVSALMTSLHERRRKMRHTVLAYVTSDPEFAPWRSYQMFIEMQEGATSRARDLGYQL
jgi:hypothetical protein